MDSHPDYDSPWKDILEAYFPEFMAFFFAEAYADIDWSRGYTFLDKELQQITRDAESGRKHVDKLVQVWRKNGEETWVLIHVEVQGQPEIGFPQRMYTYNYRIFDRYERPVVSLAILSDDQPNWHPKQFHYALWGSEVTLKFGTAKLLEYDARWQELANDPSPFAVVVMAHLKMLATRRDPEVRYDWKFTLFKMLYERGYSRKDILELWRFIDWLILLPIDLDKKLASTIADYEKERTMRYVTTIERFGEERGRREAMHENILDVLSIRFGSVPEDMTAWVAEIEEIEVLKEVLHTAVTASSLAEFIHIVKLE